MNIFGIGIFKVALKRQQAAEDAIALSMAKVATGQKLKRLPPGKIFGMAVTEPNSTDLINSSTGCAGTVEKSGEASCGSTSNTSEREKDQSNSEGCVTPEKKTASASVNAMHGIGISTSASFDEKSTKPSVAMSTLEIRSPVASASVAERSNNLQRYRNLLFNVNKTHASERVGAVEIPSGKEVDEVEDRRDQGLTISQTSVQTLANLFPSTKLSVLQLVLQRCGQDLLKAIEYFASQTAALGVSGTGSGSAFRPVQNFRETNQAQQNFSLPGIQASQTSGGQQTTPEVPNFFAFPAPAYSTFPRNIYGDSYCLLNIVPEQLQPKNSTSEIANLAIAKSVPPHEDSVALNVQYNNYFNSNIQHLREHMCNQMIEPHRQGLLHLPPIIPGIPCVQPNCSQCYKFP